jgi:hypothetical protein
MPYGKSEMRDGAERRMADARARLDAALASPDAVANGSAALADALRTYDHAAARTEANRLGRLDPEVAAAWKELDEAAKFLAFTIMNDVTDGEV